MSLLTPGMRKAIRQEAAFFVVEFDIGGSTYRYSHTHCKSDSLGFYQKKVKRFGNLSREVGLRVGQISDMSINIVLEDFDGEITALIEGSNAWSIHGSVARMKLMATNVEPSGFWTAFTGIITKFSMTAPYEWTITIGTDYRPLRGNVNLPLITDYDFPNAADDVVDTYAHLVLGEHNDSGVATGLVSCPLVDTTNYYCLASVGWIDDVTKIYVNNSTSSPGVASPVFDTDWEYVTYNGRRYTILTLASDPGTNPVEINCKGLTDSGDGSKGGGSGTLLENPADELEYLLANFVFNSWETGTLYTAASAGVPLSDERFNLAAAYFDTRNRKASRVVKGGQTGETILNEWCEQHQVPAFWTPDGELAISADDFVLSDTSMDWPWLIDNEHILSQPSYEYSTEILADEIEAKYMFSDTDNSFLRGLKVKDTRRGWGVAEALDIHWNRSSLS